VWFFPQGAEPPDIPATVQQAGQVWMTVAKTFNHVAQGIASIFRLSGKVI
jgi:hypothetical protein